MTDTPTTTLAARVARAREALATLERDPRPGTFDVPLAILQRAARLDAATHLRALSDALADVEGERDRLRALLAEYRSYIAAEFELYAHPDDEARLSRIDTALGHGGGGQ